MTVISHYWITHCKYQKYTFNNIINLGPYLNSKSDLQLHLTILLWHAEYYSRSIKPDITETNPCWLGNLLKDTVKQ